jgi:type VI secretion system secreted protein VgrG
VVQQVGRPNGHSLLNLQGIGCSQRHRLHTVPGLQSSSPRVTYATSVSPTDVMAAMTVPPSGMRLVELWADASSSFTRPFDAVATVDVRRRPGSAPTASVSPCVEHEAWCRHRQGTTFAIGPRVNDPLHQGDGLPAPGALFGGGVTLVFESGDTSLRSLRVAVHDALSTPFSISLWARSSHGDLDFEDFVGKGAAVVVDGGALGRRSWAGICSAMEQVQVEPTGLSTYYLRIVPTLWALTQRHDQRLFQHATAIEIAERLLAPWGIAVERRLDPKSFPTLELRTQYHESDYAFLARLLEEAGISYLVACSDDGKEAKLVLSDAPQAAEPRVGGPLPFVDHPTAARQPFVTQVRVARDLRPGKVTILDHDHRRKSDFELAAEARATTGGLEDRLEVRSYAPGAFLVEMPEAAAKQQDAVTGVAGLLQRMLAPLPAKLGALADDKVTALVKDNVTPLAGGVVGDLAGDLAGDAAGEIARRIAGLIASPAPGASSSRLAGDDKGFARHDPAAGTARAQRELESLRATRYRVEFSTNLVDLAPGALVSLSGHSHPALAPDKHLLITEVVFEASADSQWEARVSAVPADGPYRPQRVTPKPTMKGAQSAIVVGPPDQEIHTDEFGRVRVRFRWDRESPHDDASSCWLRVAQGWSGPGFGFVTLPRVGQEVLVGFLEGDPDQPLVVGTLFNNQSRVGHQLPGHKTRSSWKSRSSPGGEGGNEILFEDAAGSELVYLHAHKNLQEIVRNDRGAIVGRTVSCLAGEKHLLAIAQPAEPPPEVAPTSIEVVDKKITFTTGEASITLDGPDVIVEAKGTIVVRSAGDDVVIKGGPMVKINPETPGSVEARQGPPRANKAAPTEQELRAARTKAQCMARCSARSLRSSTGAGRLDAVYAKSFGALPRRAIADRFERIASLLGSATFDMDLDGHKYRQRRGRDASTVKAWVDTSEPKPVVHIGPAWPDDASDQAYTLVHEGSHLDGTTDDYAKAGGSIAPRYDSDGKQLAPVCGDDGDCYESEVERVVEDQQHAAAGNLADSYARFAVRACGDECGAKLREQPSDL